MKTWYLKKSIETLIRKFKLGITAIVLINVSVQITSGQPVLFDFDNAPVYTSLPITLTAGGITAHFSATGQGFSIQNANVLGFTPQGFSGRCIYPNSIYLADLIINFDQTLTDFSIMYSPEEYGCDFSATMKVTATMNGTLVGSKTKTARNPGTWPSDTLKCSFPQGFNKVVVHYNTPPACGDWGPIFMADNMWVTALNVSTTLNLTLFLGGLYLGNGQMMPVLYMQGMSADPAACDSITVDLHDAIQTNTIAVEVKALLQWDGNAQVVLPMSVVNHSYYIAIRHRNSIETWSKNPVLFASPMTNYDFTSP